jgi:hypothetical protein
MQKRSTYEDKPIMVTTDFSIGTLKAKRTWNDIFQALKENNCQTRLLYSTKQSFTIEGEIKTFDKNKKTKAIHDISQHYRRYLEEDKCNYENMGKNKSH